MRVAYRLQTLRIRISLLISVGEFNYYLQGRVGSGNTVFFFTIAAGWSGFEDVVICSNSFIDYFLLDKPDGSLNLKMVPIEDEFVPSNGTEREEGVRRDQVTIRIR
ncbi:MAG: hypothetical protein JXD19_00525 [Deltaproteobacteria bacterium]|nr:hypothetical protein [Deltaproteobacteria bacterium]